MGTYSSNGYNLLGAIIESVTGKNFKDVLSEELARLGLTNTELWKKDEDPDLLARFGMVLMF